MPGTPMKRRVLAALQARATRECGEGATIVDYACAFVASGHCMRELAELLASDLGHPVSRSFVSWTLNNAEPDATARLKAARRVFQLPMHKRRLLRPGSEGEAHMLQHAADAAD